MPYYGYIKVTVQMLRQGHGEDSSGEIGSGFGVVAEQAFRIEEHEVNREPGGGREIIARFTKAFDQVYGEAKVDDMQERWRTATREMTPEKMEKALAVLEAGEVT